MKSTDCDHKTHEDLADRFRLFRDEWSRLIVIDKLETGDGRPEACLDGACPVYTVSQDGILTYILIELL